MKAKIIEILRACFKEAVERFQRLEPRTRNLFLLLAAISVLSLAFDFFFKPQHRAIAALKQERIAVENRILEIQAKIPNLEQEQAVLTKEKTAVLLLREELIRLEKQLPQQDSLPGILNELFQSPPGQPIDFTLLKPVEEKKSGIDYDRINMEVRFTANYSSLFNYLRRLEQFSQFVTPTKIEIDESKEAADADLKVNMTLSALLGDSVKGASLLSAAPGPDRSTIEPHRNSFQSTLREAMLPGDQNKYVLSGIISVGRYPTAIINDEVFKIGDWVGSSQVEEISAHSVILKEGQQEVVLTIDRK